ncbi:HD domain-containing protein [Actinomadura sp. ATCC 31491]|uniref:HD domain-containing protein n=1 Tax=Actinomadura luzonensis TaxID=2805427 RepID=A0ABT0FYH2_9ACTN|nr:HD domain-containing protein [Actinomadura luzonensis]MCK2217372.1 HD domain-containing protein [Actinomadura luzonensis]
MSRDPLRPLLQAAGDRLDAEGLRKVRRAYAVAAHWHRDQRRHSGDPYITHPVAVAVILAEQGADHETLCAALLHDLLDGTACPEAELRREFGDRTVTLVLGLTELGRRSGPPAPGEFDDRVLLLKLADRLHNMRTLRWLPEVRRRAKARETLESFVPVAERLGWERAGRELQRLAAAHLPGRMSFAVLRTGAVLLPRRARGRWLEEWLGELHALPGRRARARFALGLLAGMPRMAAALRHRDVPGGPRRVRAPRGRGGGGDRRG